MCGFIGQISAGTQADRLLRGRNWLQRRGPDSQKVWASVDARVSILHARLAIVDKDPRAHQPLSDPRQGVTVAFIGEIYNYRELKSACSAYPYQTDSDTEVILAVYDTHGIEGLRLLKGMFSLVLVDEKRKQVFLAKDPVGKKPLFYASWGGELFFGVSLIPLLAVSDAPGVIDESVIPSYWRDGFIPSTRTVFKNASSVLPGEICVFDWEGALCEKCSCRADHSFVYKGESLPDIQATIRFLIEQAVARRLANNPQPSLLLSGGIDSTVTTLAAHSLQSHARFQTLTMASVIPFSKDEVYARYAASRIGVGLTRVSPVSGNITDSVRAALDLQDEPLGMISYFMLARLVKAVSVKSRVLMTGDGGDEIFLGYGKPADWLKDPGAPAADSLFPFGICPPAWMSAYAQQTVTDTLVGHMFAKVDRASAEQGVEIRCPLLDWDLIGYAWSLPFAILTHGSVSKALLKDQLVGWPRWFVERAKVGFAYNLRWIWMMQGFSGMTDMVTPVTREMFDQYLPACLRKPAHQWSVLDIFNNFGDVWRLLAWSRFLQRIDEAHRMGTV